jgi:hypothetical protein
LLFLALSVALKYAVLKIIKTAVKTAEVDEQKTKRKHEKVISQLYKVNTEQNIYNILLINMIMIPLTILSLDTDETHELKYRIFRSALALSSALNFKSVHVSNLF